MDLLEIRKHLKAEIENYYNIMDSISSNFQNMPKRYIGSVLHEYVLGLLFEYGRTLDISHCLSSGQMLKLSIELIWYG